MVTEIFDCISEFRITGDPRKHDANASTRRYEKHSKLYAVRVHRQRPICGTFPAPYGADITLISVLIAFERAKLISPVAHLGQTMIGVDPSWQFVRNALVAIDTGFVTGQRADVIIASLFALRLQIPTRFIMTIATRARVVLSELLPGRDCHAQSVFFKFLGSIDRAQNRVVEVLGPRGDLPIDLRSKLPGNMTVVAADSKSDMAGGMGSPGVIRFDIGRVAEKAELIRRCRMNRVIEARRGSHAKDSANEKQRGQRPTAAGLRQGLQEFTKRRTQKSPPCALSPPNRTSVTPDGHSALRTDVLLAG